MCLLQKFIGFQDEELARQLVELGYRGSGEVLKREEFEARKEAAEAARLSKRTQQKYAVYGDNMFDRVIASTSVDSGFDSTRVNSLTLKLHSQLPCFTFNKRTMWKASR